jgi:hypothetical protein
MFLEINSVKKCEHYASKYDRKACGDTSSCLEVAINSVDDIFNNYIRRVHQNP